jgi:hypothetical protein
MSIVTADGSFPDPAHRAAAAHGVLSRNECVRRFGEGYLRAQLDAGRWSSPTPRVVVRHNGPLTDDQKIWVVLLAAPKGAMLCGVSAAVHDGLRGFTSDELGIVIPLGSSSPRRLRLDLPAEWNVRAGWSGQLGLDDVSASAIPPRTRIARSIVDAASERIPAQRSRVLVLASVQQHLTRPLHLQDALSRRGKCRHRALIVESIRDSAGGIESLPEREFDLIRRCRHLPAPHRQQIMRRNDGRYYLDNDWPEFGIVQRCMAFRTSRSATGMTTCYAKTTSPSTAGAC